MTQENENQNDYRPDEEPIGNQGLGDAPLGDKLNQILSDPESMAKLSRMASALAGTGLLDQLGAATKSSTGGDEAAEDADSDGKTGESQKQEDTLPVSASVSKEGKGGRAGEGKRGIQAYGSKHEALLCALRPYMSRQKQERIDRILKLLKLAELADSVLKP